jgi:hypothetical protein
MAPGPSLTAPSGSVATESNPSGLSGHPVNADRAALPDPAATRLNSMSIMVEPGQRNDRVINVQETPRPIRRSASLGGPPPAPRLTSHQRVEIRRAIAGEKLARVPKLGGRLAVGTRIAEDIALHPVPPAAVGIAPQLGSYEFFLAPNGTIVMVSPGTRRIVELIPG